MSDGLSGLVTLAIVVTVGVLYLYSRPICQWFWSIWLNLKFVYYFKILPDKDMRFAKVQKTQYIDPVLGKFARSLSQAEKLQATVEGMIAEGKEPYKSLRRNERFVKKEVARAHLKFWNRRNLVKDLGFAVYSTYEEYLDS